MIRLFVQAPFAAFRTFTAGWYRPTCGFITPSAAYGLALNLAGIETRRDDGISSMTLTQFGLPRARIALGADPDGPLGPHPSVQTIFQQLHNYPVGQSGKERKEDAKGNKYNITPVRREILVGLRAFVCLEFPDDRGVEDRIRRSLAGDRLDSAPRYGLPFVGDNAFLIDRIEVHDQPVSALWYEQLAAVSDAGAVPWSTRLTIWIDRQEMSKTRSAVFAPLGPPSSEIPGAAWTLIEPPAQPRAPRSRKGGQDS